MVSDGPAIGKSLKAGAYQQWNQAAVVDKLMSSLPEALRAMLEPLSTVDRITIVSTGNDGAAGADNINGDTTKIAAQVPALFEALSGMDMKQLMTSVPGIRTKSGKVEVQRTALSA